MFRTAARHRLPAVLAAGTVLALTGLGAIAPASASAHGRHHDQDGYQQLNLVSDIPGAAQLLDPNLVNAWGLSSSPTSPIWVSDNGADVATLYRGASMPGQPVSAVPLVVTIPGGAPTGQVFNSTNDFVLPTGGKAQFIFAGEDGELSAWNGAQASTAVLVSPSRGGVYKGLAMLSTQAGNWLLAANFHDNRIELFDESSIGWSTVTPSPAWAYRTVTPRSTSRCWATGSMSATRNRMPRDTMTSPVPVMDLSMFST